MNRFNHAQTREHAEENNSNQFAELVTSSVTLSAPGLLAIRRCTQYEYPDTNSSNNEHFHTIVHFVRGVGSGAVWSWR